MIPTVSDREDTKLLKAIHNKASAKIFSGITVSDREDTKLLKAIHTILTRLVFVGSLLHSLQNTTFNCEPNPKLSMTDFFSQGILMFNITTPASGHPFYNRRGVSPRRHGGAVARKHHRHGSQTSATMRRVGEISNHCSLLTVH